MLEKLQWLVIALLVIACIVLCAMLANLNAKVARIDRWIGAPNGAAAWFKSEPPLIRARFKDLCGRIERAHAGMFPPCSGPIEEPPKNGPDY